MKFKVTITNNETGAVLVNEENAVAIIGAIESKQGTREIGFVSCGVISLGKAIFAAEDVISQAKRKWPEVDASLRLMKIMEEEEYEK